MVRNEETGVEHEHLVPPGKRFLVHTGDIVVAGKELVDGPLVPHDILRVSGEEEVQRYLLREIQQVYRSQRVEINDKHIEIIVARMLRKVKIEKAGNTSLLEGTVVDKYEFHKANEALKQCLKIKSTGDSSFPKDTLVPKSVLQDANDQLEAEGKTPAKGIKPEPATASTQLLGITKAAVQSSSFISAASFQETTKVLTEAALASKKDRLVGLKENVILGHLIPAGTGFRKFQESEVRYQADALLAMSEEVPDALVTEFPLLNADTPAPSLDSLLGGSEAPAVEENPEE